MQTDRLESPSRTAVVLMQTADLRNRDHVFRRRMLDAMRHRGIAFQQEMGAGFVMLHGMIRENPSQVGFAEPDDMIEALMAGTTIGAFDVRITPSRSWCRHDFFDAYVLGRLSEELAVDRATISKRESRLVVAWKGVDNLLGFPR